MVADGLLTELKNCESAITAGSYLELPDALSAASTLLTNINTKDDDRCFLYCFVAAYHNVNEPALYPTSRRWLETKQSLNLRSR